MPGAVLLIGHEGKVIYRKALWQARLLPQPEAMTLDTVFDCASLTTVVRYHVVADEAVRRKAASDSTTRSPTIFPNFRAAKATSLCANCSHTSRVCNLMCRWQRLGPATTLASTWPAASSQAVHPATRYVYSDINFILLDELVHRLSGKMVSQYARENIFLPAWHEGEHVPAARLLRCRGSRRRSARPVRTGPPLRGVVPRPDSTQYGRSRRSRRTLLHCRRPFALCPDDAQRGAKSMSVRLFGPLTVAGVHRAADAARSAHSARAWGGMWIRRTRPIEGNCFRSVVLVTPVSRAPRCGSTR